MLFTIQKMWLLLVYALHTRAHICAAVSAPAASLLAYHPSIPWKDGMDNFSYAQPL
jgi:hypothetical protein